MLGRAECVFENFWKLSEGNEYNFKIFKVHEGDLFQKLPQQNMWLLVNHTKLANTQYRN